jgi:hypothetical protein
VCGIDDQGGVERDPALLQGIQIALIALAAKAIRPMVDVGDLAMAVIDQVTHQRMRLAAIIDDDRRARYVIRRVRHRHHWYATRH